MWTTIFKIRVAENPRLTCLKLLLTSVMMQWSANVTMYSSSEIPMQSCLCSKSFDLYSRKDKSNIIYDNHIVYDKSYEQFDIVLSEYLIWLRL